jgi:sugar phosphate isomerase/epimerase
MTLAGDDISESVRKAAPILKHFHISSPYLGLVEEREDVDHQAAAATLKSIGYTGFVSIEMRPDEPGKNLERVRTAVTFAQQTYGA